MEKKRNKIIFLDRDGVINKDPQDSRYGYVTKWNEFKFLPGAKLAIKKLTQAGYSVYIISNQAGIAKGHFKLKDLRTVTKNMLKEIDKSGGKIKGVFYCTHKNEDNCDCRKPKAGLFRKAVKRQAVDFGKSFFIGDSIRDVQAGRAIGCKNILVLSGKTSLRGRDKWEAEPDYIKRDLLSAVKWILKRFRDYSI